MQTLEQKQQDVMTGAGPETEFHTELFGFNRVEVLSYIDVYKRQGREGGAGRHHLLRRQPGRAGAGRTRGRFGKMGDRAA